MEWTEAVTGLRPNDLVDEVYERVRGQFSETQITELTFAIAIINGIGSASVSELHRDQRMKLLA